MANMNLLQSLIKLINPSAAHNEKRQAAAPGELIRWAGIHLKKNKRGVPWKKPSETVWRKCESRTGHESSSVAWPKGQIDRARFASQSIIYTSFILSSRKKRYMGV